jgi:2-dehydropantoate 2-reductase
VSFQNDVDNEECLARHFATVIGGVYRQTCTRRAPNHAVTAGAGRIVLGSHPEGAGPRVEELASLLRDAGYDVGVSRNVRSDLWLKLCVNLMSAPNALIRREDHDTAAFSEIKVRLLEEARTVLAAAGVDASSCDGRDRSLDAEIAFHRMAHQRGMSARRLPLYNQVWASLRHGLPLESAGYHRRLLELAARHGLELPANERVLVILERAARDSLGPESASAAEFLDGL